MLSWERVSYMSKWPLNFGSPFSRGFLNNIKKFFATMISETPYTNWNLPETLPKEPIQKNCFVKCRSLWSKICS